MLVILVLPGILRPRQWSGTRPISKASTIKVIDQIVCSSI